ncbi:tetratricopeptide repeat protein [Cupriavidus sp. TMH.W2]|uniref:tetratricopeptide repeat protein n=1 Tax=Cupriavidus sp. TMH.W2 TaxID=3434465 RepID=UPI003D777B9C
MVDFAFARHGRAGKFWAAVLAGAALILGCTGATAQNVNESASSIFVAANNAVKQGDYNTAYRQYLRLATNGYPEAQFNLGLMYQRGVGVNLDPAEAGYWYEKAAANGIAEAMLNLGTLYDVGGGLGPDLNMAAQWYAKAAAAGNAQAMCNLGLLYTRNNNLQQAKYWYDQATQAGYSPPASFVQALQQLQTQLSSN